MEEEREVAYREERDDMGSGFGEEGREVFFVIKLV